MRYKLAEACIRALVDVGADFFVGVPDSVLSDLSRVLATSSPIQHMVAPNEGSAVGLGVGHFLATRKPAVVYLQNSGLGNALNPLVSLAHSNVYGIPMLLIIGYRGQVSGQDEPQHEVQGQVTVPWLTAAGVPVAEISDPDAISLGLAKSFDQARKIASPVCVLVGRGLLDSSQHKDVEPCPFPTRSEIIEAVLRYFGDHAIYVSTTGKASRELAAMSDSEYAQNAFLCIGGMGHAASIALGAAVGQPNKRIICVDGDGSFQMHMGAAALIGAKSPSNLFHIVINNGVHDSVGGQPTANPELRYGEIAKELNYASAKHVDSIESLLQHLVKIEGEPGPHFIEVLSAPGSEWSLKRPTMSPRDRMRLFLNYGD